MSRSTVTAVLIVVAGMLALHVFVSVTGPAVGVDEMREKIEREPGVVIDVRTRDEHEQGHLAITDYQFDFLSGEFRDNLADLDKDQTYYLYCRSGNRSGRAATMMHNLGFEKVYNIGGFNDLVRGGFEASS